MPVIDTGTWNSVTESNISASTTDSFKNKLVKFGAMKILYDYKAQLTEIGDRSIINNLYLHFHFNF